MIRDLALQYSHLGNRHPPYMDTSLKNWLNPIGRFVIVLPGIEVITNCEKAANRGTAFDSLFLRPTQNPLVTDVLIHGATIGSNPFRHVDEAILDQLTELHMTELVRDRRG